MKSDEREKVLNWYEECVNNNYVFDFNKELIEYCRSDVDILRRSMIEFREDFIKLENIDPLRYITIASVCMSIYHANYMPEKTIAIVPEYVKSDNFSKTSIMWLDYLTHKNNIQIQHALNGGEMQLTINNQIYKVDGYCKENNTVYEFYGCFGHGCTNCYRSNINNKNQKDMGTLNKNTYKKIEFKHVSIYECQLKNHKDFQKCVKNYNKEMVDSLNPRDAFYGGGTNATKFLYNF